MRKTLTGIVIGVSLAYFYNRRAYFTECAKAGYQMGEGKRPFEPFKMAEQIWDEMYK